MKRSGIRQEFRHFSLIASIDCIKFVLVLSETVLVLVLDRCCHSSTSTACAEYEQENAVNLRRLSPEVPEISEKCQNF